MRPAALAALSLTLAAPSAASDFILAQPIDCSLNQTCFIQHLVDRDPGPGIRDFACGSLSYDGHKGTDFALPTLADMQKGVDVRAAAPGVVTGRRDGMPDTGYSDETAAGIEGRECGNGVVIDHGDGWETQYCHLAEGSLNVEPGQQVATGAILGRVGLSGQTEFPHLHLSLRKDGAVVDPFAARPDAACGAGPSLWQHEPPYRPGGLLDLGFAAQVPDYAAVIAGTAHDSALDTRSPALVAFVFAYGARAKDQFRIRITGPEGIVLDETVDLDRDYARVFRAVGKRLRFRDWPAGPYEAMVEMLRAGKVLDQRQRVIRLD
jgi:hypothetical protein